MKARYFLVLLPVLLAIALMATTFVPTNIGVGAVTGSSNILTYHSLVQVYKNGELWDETHNLVTNLGKERLINGAFLAANASECRWLGVGGNTSAMAVTDTTLGGDFQTIYDQAYGMNRSAATRGWSGTGMFNITLTYTFTATQACNVNATGLFNTTGTGLCAEASFTNAALQSSDTLNVTWYVWVA